MTLARAANRALDRGDALSFDLMASLSDLSGRELDQAIRNTPTDDLEAVLPKPVSTNTPHRAA